MTTKEKTTTEKVEVLQPSIQEIIVPQQQDIVVSNDVDVFKTDVGLGTSEIKSSDIKFPMIKLLQKMSPQVDSDDSQYIEGAKPGDFLNTDTNELYADGFHFLPAAFIPLFIEWVKREKGGGIVKVFSHNEGLIRSEQPVSEDHELTMYHSYFGFIVDLKTFEYSPCILSLTSSGFTASRKLNFKIKNAETKGLPIFANIYHFQSVLTENAKGKFYKYDVDLQGQINHLWAADWQTTVYAEAKELAKQSSVLASKVDFSAMSESSAQDYDYSVNNDQRDM